jgi:aminoglycoside phosphotransferase (APT) family kinase protein
MTGLTATELEGIASVLASEGVKVDGPLSSALIAGGRSNLTFRIEDAQSSWVLRTPPRQGRTPSAHDVGREFRVTRALSGTEVPVPRAIALCEDESLLGGPFAVWEFVDGRTVQSLKDLSALDDETVTAVTGRLIEALAALHSVDHAAAGLERFGRPDGYADRQIRRWWGQWELIGSHWPDLQRPAAELHARLSGSVPSQPHTRVVHGDFRIDNTILRLAGAPAIAAIVDWELATLGDPVADVALMCAYRHPAFDLIVGEPSAWTSDRLLDTDGLATAYEGAGGVPLDHWDFHLALAYFKLSVIAAGIDHRQRAGGGSGAGFETAGESVPLFLEAGLGVTPAGPAA